MEPRGIVLYLRIVDRAPLREVVCNSECHTAVKGDTHRTSENVRSRAIGKRSALESEPRAREAITCLVDKGTAESPRPVQRYLLVARWDIDPCASGKAARCSGLDVLLENVTGTHAILARELNVHAARE